MSRTLVVGLVPPALAAVLACAGTPPGREPAAPPLHRAVATTTPAAHHAPPASLPHHAPPPQTTTPAPPAPLAHRAPPASLPHHALPHRTTTPAHRAPPASPPHHAPPPGREHPPAAPADAAAVRIEWTDLERGTWRLEVWDGGLARWRWHLRSMFEDASGRRELVSQVEPAALAGLKKLMVQTCRLASDRHRSHKVMIQLELRWRRRCLVTFGEQRSWGQHERRRLQFLAALRRFIDTLKPPGIPGLP